MIYKTIFCRDNPPRRLDACALLPKSAFSFIDRCELVLLRLSLTAAVC
jgi:hypothetical protein